MTPILTLALSLLVSLGAELPVGNTATRPAVANQTLRDVASNGRDFLALWSDERGAPFAGSRLALYTARIGGSDEHLIADSTFSGTLFWDGSAYELLYMLDTGHTLLQRLDDDGKPAGAPTEVEVSTPPREAATNGRNFLTLMYSGGISMNSLSGAAIWRQVIGPPLDASPIAVLPNGDYRFAALTNNTVILVTVDGTTGMISSNRVLATGVDRMGAYVLPNGNALVAWTQGATAFYELVDVTQPAIFAADATGANVAAGWDGRQFGITLATESRLRLSRVAADGRLLDPAPQDLGGGGPAQNVHFAASATRLLVAGDVFNAPDFDWDVVARNAGSFDDVAGAAPRSIATSLAAQQRPRVADGGLVLWLENDLFAQVPGTATPHTIASGPQHAGVGRGTSSYLVAWMADGKVLGKRVAFDGTPIDAAPLTLADARPLFIGYDDATPAIAFDGTNYLVVWPIDQNLQAVRVAQDGRPIDAQPIAVTNYLPRSSFPTILRAVWSGSRFVVAWVDQGYSLVLISPRPPAPSRVGIVTLSASGAVLDANPRFVFDKVGVVGSLGLAANGDSVELLWTLDCVYELPLHGDGTPAAAARTLACGTVSSADAAWDGNEYVAVWTDSDVVKGERLDVDDAPFDVSPAGVRASQSSVGAGPSGAMIAYVRYAGGAPRVFARALQRSGTPPRHRPSH